LPLFGPDDPSGDTDEANAAPSPLWEREGTVAAIDFASPSAILYRYNASLTTCQQHRPFQSNELSSIQAIDEVG